MTTLPRRPIEDILPGLTEAMPALEGLAPGDAMAEIALTVSGLGGDRESDREIYLSVLCPEREVMLQRTPRPAVYVNEYDWLTMYSCALVCRSHMRRFGVRSADLGLLADGTRTAYRSADAMADLQEAAALSPGALIKPGEGFAPARGQIWIIGDGPQTHALCVVDVSGRIVTSVDGGQPAGWCEPRKKPYNCILTCERRLAPSGRGWTLDGRVLHFAILPEMLLPSAPRNPDLI